MRTVAQETVFQIALRNCSKEVGGVGGGQYICDFGGREYMQSSTDFLQKVSASLLEVIASHEEQMPP